MVALDVRGHGESDKPHAADSYGSYVLEDVVGLMDHLGIPESHVVGYSMGGGIVLGLLRDHPDRFRSAVVGGIGVVTADFLATRAGMTTVDLEERFSSHPDLARLDLNALVAIQQNYWDIYVTPENFPTIRVPLAAVIGGDDPLALEDVERLSELHPETQVTILPGYNHVQAPASDEFRATVLDFLAEVDGR